MTKYIRWQGLAGFLVVLILLMLFIYVFAGTLIKHGIEQQGAEYLGAEVNVEQVEVNFLPLKLNITKFQATDKREPSLNMVSFERASLSVNWLDYLFGRIHLEDLQMLELAFSTPRAAVGEVYSNDNAEQVDAGSDEASGLAALDISLPDPKQLLNDSNLLTVQRAEQITKSYREEKAALASLQQKLPDQASLQSYQDEIQALSDSKVKSLEDLELIKEKFSKLKKQFQQDKAIVKQAKQQLQLSKTTLSEQLSALKNSPSEDWQRIEQQYQLEQVDLGDFAHMFFGEQARSYLDYFKKVMAIVQPLLTQRKGEQQSPVNSANGRFVKFDEEHPQPDFLLDHGQISMLLPLGKFSITIDELTTEHWLRGKATKINIVSKGLVNGGNVELNSELNSELSSTKQQEYFANGQWQIDGIALSAISLYQGSGLSLAINQGQLAGKGHFDIKNKALNSGNAFALSKLVYDASANSSLTRALVDTIKSKSDLALDLTAKGALLQPKLTIKSDLDNLLKSGLQQQLTTKVDGFKSQMQQGLNSKLSSALKTNQTEAQQILDMEKLFTDTENSLDALINSDVVQKQKDKLADKAKDKLKDKLKKLFD